MSGRFSWNSCRWCLDVDPTPEFDFKNGMLFVRDLGSRHGSLINGRFAAEAPLTAGDRLTVGLTTFVVSYENSEERQN